MTAFIVGLIVALTVVGWLKRDHLPDAALIAVGIVMLVEGFALLLGGTALVVAWTEMPGQVAQIEQLRADVQRVDVAESEDVIGQVVQWNQHVRSKQRYNEAWWAGWAVPNKWDSVALIELPKRGAGQ
jgi:hypothetical protein